MGAKRLTVTLISLVIMLSGIISSVSAHSLPGCPRAQVFPKTAPDATFSATGPAVVEVWYEDASENGKPSWGNALRKVYLPAGVKGKFFDAKGKVWDYVNNSACRHDSQHDYANSPRTPVSRTTLVNEHVAAFIQIA